MENYEVNKKRKAEYNSPEDLIISDDEYRGSIKANPVDMIRAMSKEDKDQVYKYLRLLNYNGDPLLEQDLIYFFNAECDRLREQLANPNTKWKSYVQNRLDKYLKYIERLNNRIDYRHFKE